jgi:heme exporter protein D
VLAYHASRDLIPLYSVYALLFTDSGLSVAQVSSLFVIWSVTAFVLEVPSGAWADTIDRRRLLVLSALVHAAGFASWVLLPTYAGFALGFVLWGVAGSIVSGTFESLLYDELDAHGRADRYTRIVGWAHASAMVANLVASVSAAPLLALGGYALVGWVSVGVCLVELVLAATLPVTTQRLAQRHHGAAEAVHDVAVETERVAVRYVAMLRSGVREASRVVVVRRVVLVYAAVIGASAYDEYFPLVAAGHGVAASMVPWLIGLVVLGQVVGTALAGRTAAMSGAAMRWVLLGAALLISTGALVSPLVGFAAIAVGYGLLNNAMVVTEARLQDVITGPARATVTSVAGVATEVVALTVYVAFAATSGLVSVPVQVAALGVPLAVVALLTRRWLPPSRAAGRTRRSGRGHQVAAGASRGRGPLRGGPGEGDVP